MKISCLMVSHNKPGYVDCAIQGVLDQKHTDWELLVMDSGVLYDQNYFSKWKDERIKFIRSSETDETRKNKAMAPWCFNQTLKAATGDLITYHGDDDLLYENAFDVFNRWMTNNKKMLAIYASIDLAFYVHGEVAHVYGQRKAFEIGGSGAYSMDCRVDSLQFCHRKELLEHLEDYWPDGLDTASHADGVFMDKVGKICYIYPIPVKIGQNRRTPISVYDPFKESK